MNDLVTYDDVNNAWGGLLLPPVTEAHAKTICRKLVHKFGGRTMSPWFLRQFNRSWAAPKGTSTTAPRGNGLPRMVHDASHYVFSKLHPTFKTHSAAHADLEKQMIECVLANSWHLPKPTAIPPRDQIVAAELVKVEARIKRWQTKAKRAATALSKLARKQRNLRARLEAAT